MTVAHAAGILAVDIMKNGFHKPLISGKANQDNIEEHITVAILSGALTMCVTQEIVNLAVYNIDAILKEHNAND